MMHLLREIPVNLTVLASSRYPCCSNDFVLFFLSPRSLTSYRYGSQGSEEEVLSLHCNPMQFLDGDARNMK